MAQPEASGRPSDLAGDGLGWVAFGFAVAFLAAVPVDAVLAKIAEGRAPTGEAACEAYNSGAMYWPPGGWMLPLAFVLGSAGCLAIGLVQASRAKRSGRSATLMCARLTWGISAGALPLSMLGLAWVYIAGNIFFPC